MELLLEWKGFRRLYIYAMTENMKSIIRRWHNALFTEEIKKKLGITERQVYSSATLLELDDIYTRRLAGFPNLPGPNGVHQLSGRPNCSSSTAGNSQRRRSQESKHDFHRTEIWWPSWLLRGRFLLLQPPHLAG